MWHLSGTSFRCARWERVGLQPRSLQVCRFDKSFRDNCNSDYLGRQTGPATHARFDNISTAITIRVPNVARLPCGHMFCYRGIVRHICGTSDAIPSAFLGSNTCPYCRRELFPRPVVHFEEEEGEEIHGPHSLENVNPLVLTRRSIEMPQLRQGVEFMPPLVPDAEQDQDRLMRRHEDGVRYHTLDRRFSSDPTRDLSMRFRGVREAFMRSMDPTAVAFVPDFPAPRRDAPPPPVEAEASTRPRHRRGSADALDYIDPQMFLQANVAPVPNHAHPRFRPPALPTNFPRDADSLPVFDQFPPHIMVVEPTIQDIDNHIALVQRHIALFDAPPIPGEGNDVSPAARMQQSTVLQNRLTSLQNQREALVRGTMDDRQNVQGRQNQPFTVPDPERPVRRERNLDSNAFRVHRRNGRRPGSRNPPVLLRRRGAPALPYARTRSQPAPYPLPTNPVARNEDDDGNSVPGRVDSPVSQGDQTQLPTQPARLDQRDLPQRPRTAQTGRQHTRQTTPQLPPAPAPTPSSVPASNIQPMTEERLEQLSAQQRRQRRRDVAHDQLNELIEEWQRRQQLQGTGNQRARPVDQDQLHRAIEEWRQPPQAAEANEQQQQQQRHRHVGDQYQACLLYTSPSPRDGLLSRMPSSA